MGPYKPLRDWIEFPIPYYMEIMGVDGPWHAQKKYAMIDPQIFVGGHPAMIQMILREFKGEVTHNIYIYIYLALSLSILIPMDWAKQQKNTSHIYGFSEKWLG